MSNRFDLPNITYGQLHNALIDLGFDHQVTDTYTAYRNAQHDAIIALPIMESNAIVIDPHLVAVTNTIVGKGVASQDTFYEILDQLHESSSADGLATISPMGEFFAASKKVSNKRAVTKKAKTPHRPTVISGTVQKI